MTRGNRGNLHTHQCRSTIIFIIRDYFSDDDSAVISEVLFRMGKPRYWQVFDFDAVARMPHRNCPPVEQDVLVVLLSGNSQQLQMPGPENHGAVMHRERFSFQ